MPHLHPQALADIDLLAPAVKEFLFAVYNAGLIPVPETVVRRYRVLKRLVARAVRRPAGNTVVSVEVGQESTLRLLTCMGEIQEIDGQFPPPDLAPEIRVLMDERGIRALAGEPISPDQEAEECARIEAALNAWPPKSVSKSPKVYP